MKSKHNLDTETIFAEVQKMLYKLAWDAAKAQGLDFDECLRECYYAFVKALNWRYDPRKGTKFSTTCYTIAKFRLQNLARQRQQAVQFEEINEEVVGFAPVDRCELLDVIAELSTDAQTMASMLLEAPRELRAELPTPKRLLYRVKDYLRGQGWASHQVDSAQEELQTALRMAWAS